jgi:ribosome-associated translation inhibitor RaiA
MQVQIRHDSHVQGDKNDWITHTVEDKLAAYELTTVVVHLADEDGPKNSDGAIRCTIEARPAGFEALAATAHGDDVGVAVDGALDKLERLLQHQLDKVRDHHANL